MSTAVFHKNLSKIKDENIEQARIQKSSNINTFKNTHQIIKGDLLFLKFQIFDI